MSITKTESGSNTITVPVSKTTEKLEQEVTETALSIVNTDQTGVSEKKFSGTDLSDQAQYCIFENLIVMLDGENGLLKLVACVCKSWFKNAFVFVRANELRHVKKMIGFCSKEEAEVFNQKAEDQLNLAVTLQELEPVVECFFLNELTISDMTVDSLTQLQTEIKSCPKYIQTLVCQVIIGKLKREIESCYKDNETFVTQADIEVMRYELRGRNALDHNDPNIDDKIKLAGQCAICIQQNHFIILKNIHQLTVLGDLSKAIQEVECLSDSAYLSYFGNGSKQLVNLILSEASQQKNQFEKAWELIEKTWRKIPYLTGGDFKSVQRALASLFCSCAHLGQIERAVKLIENSSQSEAGLNFVTNSCFSRFFLEDKDSKYIFVLNKSITRPLVMKIFLGNLFSKKTISLNADQIAELVTNQSPTIYDVESEDLSIICDIFCKFLEYKYLNGLKVVFERMKLIQMKNPRLYAEKFVKRLSIFTDSSSLIG